MIREMKIIDDQTQVSIAGSIYIEDANNLREKLATLINKGHKYLLIDLSQRGLFPIPQNRLRPANTVYPKRWYDMINVKYCDRTSNTKKNV